MSITSLNSGNIDFYIKALRSLFIFKYCSM